MIKKLYAYHERRKQYYRKNQGVYHVVSILSILFWVFLFKSVVLDANNIPTGSMIPTLKIGDLLFVNKMRYTVHFPFTDTHMFRIDTPKRGDVVTFTPPASADLQGKRLVKRIIGMPGDEVTVVDDEIYVSGIKYKVEKETDRSALIDIDHPKIPPDKKEFEAYSKSLIEIYNETLIDPKTGEEIKTHHMLKNPTDYNVLRNSNGAMIIPEGKYMMMGDNRDNSDDSRRWGFVDLDDIHGKVFMAYFSVNQGSRYEVDDANLLRSFMKLITFKGDDIYVRWDRIGKRIN